MEWTQILVVILSVFLALFLLLSIILFIMLIRVVKQIKSVTSTAERTAMKFEDVANGIMAYSSPIVVGKFVSSFLNKTKRNKKN